MRAHTKRPPAPVAAVARQAGPSGGQGRAVRFGQMAAAAQGAGLDVFGYPAT
jgi:hypothetical protein